MHRDPFEAKASLREGCPFSFEFLLFVTEAGIRDQLELIRCDAGPADFQTIKPKLQAGLHKAAFPPVELEPGRYLSDSDALVRYCTTSRPPFRSSFAFMRATRRHSRRNRTGET